MLNATVPVTSVPIRLPCTMLLVAPALSSKTPELLFPEMTLRSDAFVPPIRLAEPVATIPKLAFGSAAVPAAFVPMKFP